jgi:hypothetical protein
MGAVFSQLYGNFWDCQRSKRLIVKIAVLAATSLADRVLLLVYEAMQRQENRSGGFGQ